ncbi:DoxX family protein [Hymenobacter sp. BT635]|uniref:DoxX family protein n=1 Tax=Hymenobacter nitidus TaxID=2880929 RepID=A0ABS8AA20_9BACT|nr:DoxX family protein [Hymenobacter nitidus]MCB2377250.1 DoxX family protein [Hymenobacter nitidus]
MTKQAKRIYWVATGWLALGMLSAGLAQVANNPAETDFMANLGYPFYLPPLLGIWKVLGVVALLAPRFPLLKEWAYAGFFFSMTGAIVSHLAAHKPASTLFPSLLLLALTVVSWYSRPADSRIPTLNQ